MKINSLSCSPDSAQRITQSGWPILLRRLGSSQYMAQIKTPAEINEKCVNMAIYTELFNGAEQSSLVRVEREEGVFGVWESWNGFVADCSRPQKIKSFSSPKGKCCISGLINWSRVGFFPPEAYLFQSASNDWALPRPGSAGRTLETPRTLACIGVCKSCSLAFQQVPSDLLRSRNLKDLNKDVTERLGKLKIPSATAKFKVDLN